MKTLRLIKFLPSKGQASRYWEEDGFRRNDLLSLSDLTPQQQAIVGAAMAWAVSQLPAGFTGLESVELKKVSDVVTSWSIPQSEDEPSVPLAYSPAFIAAVVGNGEHGQSAVEISSQPGEVAESLNTLWEALAQ